MSKCFDVSMYKPTSDFKWSFGHCSGSEHWLGSGIYTNKCCISEGWHILSCSISSLGKYDWSRSPLTLLGHTFCDDFVGRIAFISLNISGDYMYKFLYFHTQINTSSDILFHNNSVFMLTTL